MNVPLKTIGTVIGLIFGLSLKLLKTSSASLSISCAANNLSSLSYAGNIVLLILKYLKGKKVISSGVFFIVSYA